MNYHYYEKYINKNTTNKYDLTTVFEHQVAFQNLIKDLCQPFSSIDFDTVIGLDSLGFILGGACAFHMKKRFVAVRKGGGFPVDQTLKTVTQFTDYSGKEKSLEMRNDSISKGDRVLIVDDWIETGTQVRATIKMVTSFGGQVIGLSAIGFEQTEQTRDLLEGYQCFALKFGADI